MTSLLNLQEAKQASKRAARSPSNDDQDQRRVIQIRLGEQPRVVDEAEAALRAADVQVFVRAGRLVQPIQEEALATGNRSTIVGRIKELCQDSLSDLIGRVATFQKFSDQKQQWVRADPPRWVASILLARSGEWKLPHLAGVITTPTLRPDGSLLSEPGYDAATRLSLFLDEGFRMPRIEARPTRADAERALQLLSDLLAHFPFVSEIDRAVALSGILTTVVRPCLPVAPLHAIRAHSPGTGKSFLVDVFSAIATGQVCPALAAGKTEEETEKRLGARLLQAHPIISIDNVNGELGGDLLCQMTERALVAPRILGKSEAPDIECRAMVFANGNNLVLVGDMTRRTVLCTLDAKVERPELRAFDFDPVSRVLADRGTYVAAVLTIVRAYRVADRPNRCPPLGSYGAWSDTVRSALVWLGEADPAASMETTRAEDPKLAAQRELFEHWQECLAEACFYSATEITNVACEADHDGNPVRPLFRDLLLRMTRSSSPRPSPVSIGKWLAELNGRVSGGYRLDAHHDLKRGNRYALMRIRDGTDPDSF